MEKIIVESPSKINIGLNIVEKRKDGFHNLETIFYPLLLSDQIEFEKSGKIDFNSNSEILNKSKENLILKAINLLEVKTSKEINVKINLNKMIPIGAGLGGGSSNAAITLKAINKLFDLELSTELLAETALELGSDVPFFLTNTPSYAESIGEKLQSLNLELQYPILIVNPGVTISTQWAFEYSPVHTMWNSRLWLLNRLRTQSHEPSENVQAGVPLL